MPLILGRVLFPFSASTFGGSHASALLLMRELPRLGFEPVAVVLDKGPMQDRLAQAGIEHHWLDMPSYQSGQSLLTYLPVLMRIAPKLARIIRRLNVQVVHTNDSRMANTWVPAARLAGCKVVLHQRTRFAPSRLLEWNARRADAMITISDYVRSTLPPALAARAEVIHNPIDGRPGCSRTPARAMLAKALGLQASDQIVAFVGTLSAQKRPEIFVQVAALMAAEVGRSFLVFGRGSEAEVAKLRSLAESLGLGQRFRVVGFRADIQAAMAACDLILVPAVNEGFGRVPLEAAVLGTPVVAAASGGHFESIIDGKTGVLVPPDDARAMAAAAISLLANPDIAADMVRAGQDFVRDQFSPTRHAERVAAVYRRLA